MSSYSWVLNKIKTRLADLLNEKEDKLTDSDLNSSVELTKKVLKSIDTLDGVFRDIYLSGHKYKKLSEQDWERISREIKSIYSVSFNPGTGIRGVAQRNRNTTWWSDKYRYSKDNFYWNRYKKLLEKELGRSIVQTTDQDTTFVLDNIGNPDEDGFSIYGMVVGYVQSGKTANYSGVVCKAADAGYRFIIVIAGDKNNLRDQTQERIDQSFVGWSLGRNIGVGIEGFDNSKRPVSFTKVKQDFNVQRGDTFSGLTSGHFTTPVILVVKKNGSILKNLIKWLKNDRELLMSLPMLIIDDESDYASVNTKEEEDPTSINSKIRELIGLSNKSSYVAYTATPFANIFIDHQAKHFELGQDLFPRDFIYALNAPTNYFGSEEVLVNGKDFYLTEIDDYQDILPITHKKDQPLNDSLPGSLYDSVRCFILAVVIRSMRGQEDKHKSMLIHASRFTIKHSEIAELIGEYLERLVGEVMTYSKLDNSPEGYIKDLRETFEREYVDKINLHNTLNPYSEIEVEFSWDQIRLNLSKYSSTIKIREVHQNTVVRLEYDEDDPINVIVIGGLSLSRGFTLEGLTVSYFLRGTLFYDTLMQMARWYGYRTGYKDLCRIYMSEDMVDNYLHIHEASRDLMGSFKEMVQQKRTPEDFGLAVKEHPDNLLKVTAVGKMSNTKTLDVDIRLEGTLRETVRINNNTNILKSNYQTASNIIKELSQNYSRDSFVKSGVLWRDVSKNIIIEFLKNFIVYDGDGFGGKSKMPILFVREFANNNDGWDVALYEGKGNSIEVEGVLIRKEIRRLRSYDNFYALPSRQLSSENAEAISLPEGDDKRKGVKDRRWSRKYPGRNNLLMLHIIQDKDDEHSNIACFGVSFSGDGVSHYKNIRIRMNKVMIEERDSAITNNTEQEEYEQY